MSSNQKLTLVRDAEGFFYELLGKAIENHRLKIRPEAEVYLLKLLTEFMRPEKLYTQDGQGHLKDEPLTFLLKGALEERHPEVSKKMFRKLGDLSLYFAGFFQESLQKKMVDVDYYIEIGGTAYSEVASRTPENNAAEMYGEMSQKFGSLVDVFSEMSALTLPKTEQNLLKIYENWIQTKNKKAEKILMESGILPVDQIKKTNN